jgi:CheY-like chemotaxis protein
MATILVWMDSAVGKDRIRATLKHHEQIPVEKMQDALEVLRTKKVDLILCGLNFEHESVFDLLRAVKQDQSLASIPFIVVRGSRKEMSKSLNEAVRLATRTSGATEYIDSFELYAPDFSKRIDGILGI